MAVTGRVVRFDEFRGYGFVSPDTGGEDVFMHVNDLEFDKRFVTPGALVEFVVEDGQRGLKASHVQILGEPGVPATPRASHPVAAPTPAAGTEDPADDGMCDVLSSAELSGELTEALLAAAPSLTGEQILAVRRRFREIAASHGWVEGD
ncbi:cold shock domain-containing protein [Amycolatopsis minnesotensis]|uniref:Cold shock domain-containing protein n=1 Tax=Amycolatopsis minnesotensis TaxID=337894 RepID=A0ABN2Q3Q7_9PSEU